MQKRAYFSTLLVVLIAVFGWGGGCSASDDTPPTASSGATGNASGNSSGTNAGAGGAGGCLINCNSTGSNTGGSNQGAIVITPDDPELLVVNGAIPTQAFTATLNGADVTANVTWLYERPDIGDVAAASTFTPTGVVGGIGKLTAQWNDAAGETTVAVKIQKTVDQVGLTPAQIAELENPTGGEDPSVSILYPNNETVFPLAVLAPEIQWSGGGAGDIYRLRLTEKYYEYTGYFTTSPPARHLMQEPDWQSVENSGTGATSDPLGMALTRMSGPTAFLPKTQTWHIAQGRLRGSVYYWELPDACENGIASGRILRIKPDSTVVDEFFQPGQCWGCHTVSRDGKTMAATFEQEFPLPNVTIDLVANPAVLGTITVGSNVRGTFSAFNDKGDKLLHSNNASGNANGAFTAESSSLNILDAVTGQVLTPNALPAGCGEPAWSPDGKKIAGVCGLSGGWTFDASTGDLTVADVAPDGVTVSNQQQIVPGSGGAGRPAYPTFSPGSESIAFGRPTSGSQSTGNGDLWMVGADGSGLKQLSAASNDNRSFNPVFAPLRAGGYFWLVYISRRDYGNTLVGTNRQQLWVTAISDPPSAADPSHPPFYMRGQEGCGKSENAYYALDPCKDEGQGCTSGVDCCNGQCVKDPNTNEYICGEPPPPGQCSETGNSCRASADCCDFPEVECIDGFCQVPPPQ